jgi:hypothetical protein
VGHATGHDRKLCFYREPLGQRQPWEVIHRRIAYAGEVVVAKAVDADLGLPLGGDVCFRNRVLLGATQDTCAADPRSAHRHGRAQTLRRPRARAGDP